MGIGSRNFPYPILNHEVEFSGYKEDIFFELKFDCDDSGAPYVRGEQIIFKNICIETNSELLKNLLDTNDVKAYVVFECSNAIYGKTVEIGQTPKDISIPIRSVKKKLELSGIVYAAKDNVCLNSNEFLEDYVETTFFLDKYALVAIDEGIVIPVEFDDSVDNRVASIFTIVRNLTNQHIEYRDEESHICIELPKDAYESYETIKKYSKVNYIAFSAIAIPVLAECINDIRSDRENGLLEIEDLVESKPWMKSVILRYEKTTNSLFTRETLEQNSGFAIAQIVLGGASVRAVQDLEMLMIEGCEGDDDA